MSNVVSLFWRIWGFRDYKKAYCKILHVFQQMFYLFKIRHDFLFSHIKSVIIITRLSQLVKSGD